MSNWNLVICNLGISDKSYDKNEGQPMNGIINHENQIIFKIPQGEYVQY